MEQIKPGAKARVYERVKEGDKERSSAFEGIIIACKHGRQTGATFTVRGKIEEYGLEKIYPIYSPLISKVEIIEKPRKVRRAKLYYIRSLSSKKIRSKIKQII